MATFPVTAISFGSHPHSWSEWMLEKTSNYLHLWGEKAYIAPDSLQQGPHRCVFLAEDAPSPWEVAIKIMSYCTLLFPLIAVMIYLPLRACHEFNVVQIDPLLAQDLTVDQELEQRLDGIIQSYRRKDFILDLNLSIDERVALAMEYDKEVESRRDQRAQLGFRILSESGFTTVFYLEDKPELLFKIAGSQSGSEERLERRFENKLKGKAVCLAHDFDHLTIPKVRRIYRENKMVLIEERLPITQGYTTQHRYEASPPDSVTTETVRQVVAFIAHTNWSDVAYRNIPLIDEPSSERHNNVALIDLEEGDGAAVGVYGGPNPAGLNREGLMSCLHAPEHILTAVLTSVWFGLIPWRLCSNRINSSVRRALYSCGLY